MASINCGTKGGNIPRVVYKINRFERFLREFHQRIRASYQSSSTCRNCYASSEIDLQ